MLATPAVEPVLATPAVESVLAPPAVEETVVASPTIEETVTAGPVEEIVPTSAVVDQPASASANLGAPVVESPAAEQPEGVTSPVAEPPAISVEASVPASASAEQALAEAQPTEPEESAAAPSAPEPEHAPAPSAEELAQTDSFATAATEVPVSETPVALATDPHAPSGSTEETQVADESALSAEPAPPEPPAAEAGTPSDTESVLAAPEGQDQPQHALQTNPAHAGPPRSFTSSGSEMPVVITAPAPRKSAGSSPVAHWLDLGREAMPRAQAWSRKTLRTAPRALVVTAPFIALFGIWAVHSMVTRNKQASIAAAIATSESTPSGTPQVAAANAAPPASAILVSTSVAPTPAPPEADAAALASAVSRGLPALEALAQKFPSDPQVGIALASQQAQAQRFEAAVSSIERVISASPKSAQNGKVMGILWRAAQSSASEPSFSALRKLGGRGSDIAFDLATTAGVRDSVRERAKRELKNSLAAEASEDTRVATALLLAPDCGARKALLERAEREGGKRTLALLEGFARGSACTSTKDAACNACLTGTAELAHAQAQLSSGAKK